jgi:hypothetical protein
MTAGVQRIPGANAAWRITLSDDDPMDRIDATPVEEEEAKHLSDVSFVPAELVPRRIRESLLLSG